MNNKIGIFFGNGYEEIEALTVVDLCRRAGLSIDMISISDERKVAGSHGIVVEMDQILSEVDFDALDMIVLPGGMPGTKNLEACKGLMDQVDRFYENGKYVAAICAAPSILGHKGFVKGRKACCYPGFESAMEGAEVVKEEVVVSDHLIMSRGMGCAIPFGLKIVETFTNAETAKQLSDSVIYRL